MIPDAPSGQPFASQVPFRTIPAKGDLMEAEEFSGLAWGEPVRQGRHRRLVVRD